ILDYTNGLFATGTGASSTGIELDAAWSSADKIGIKGTATADKVVLGKATGYYTIDMNGDNKADVRILTTSTDLPAITLYLGDGNDTFSAGTLSSLSERHALLVYGGAGNDTFIQTATATPDEVLDGGSGLDVVTYQLRGENLSVSVGAGADDGDPGTTGSQELDDILESIETVTGGSGVDTLIADDDKDTILNGGPGNDIITGGTGTNVLSGGDGDDQINGGAGDDTLNGDAGNDTLAGGDDDDILNGGVGDDTFNEATAGSNTGNDIFNGGAGTDVVDYSSRTCAVTVTMDGTAANDGCDGETDNVKADVENLKGTPQADKITGNSGNNWLFGGAGSDELDGGKGDDYFYEWTDCPISGTTDRCSGAGTSATAGDESNGNDTIKGGDGVDTVDYARELGVVVVMDGATASGQTGGSGTEADIIGTDVENCFGSESADTLTGNAAANLLAGYDGDDTLSGSAGADELDGGAGTNIVNGDDGEGDVCYNAGTFTGCEFTN
ncbi:MAG: calcium-binding protein, partial [Myxococcales bacterium]